MINHKHKFIFTHIPKTGGTSILSLFTKNYKHKSHTKTISLLNNENFKKYYKFTIVRNPWDRMVSLYFWKIMVHKIKSLDFKLFIDYLNNHSKLEEIFQRDANIVNHTKGYIDFYLKDSANKYDHIGRFEDLHTTFLELKLKFDLKSCMPHLFKTKHKHYTEYYDDETREIVAEKYAKDIEYFGYKFGE